MLTAEYFDKKAGLEDGSIEKLAEVYEEYPDQAMSILAGILDPSDDTSAFAWAVFGVVHDVTGRGLNIQTELNHLLKTTFPDTYTDMADELLAKVIPQINKRLPSGSQYGKQLTAIVASNSVVTDKRRVRSIIKKLLSSKSPALRKAIRSHVYLLRELAKGSLAEYLFGGYTSDRKKQEKIIHAEIVEFIDFGKTGRLKPKGQLFANINENKPKKAYIKLK